ncbi:NUDIX domain-containing protein [Mesobacillus persicus]|uniref:NUDIX domain-containing protein n=1 Tax=Mesobacillus persicus TaxID=930146 RepID=A0A1H7W1F8_9BACI|nr:NUDIX hydrolase [Mesobacillus persicus]SEM15422.1 NUDIX domain-containing protein [Mesobacillus persicus]
MKSNPKPASTVVLVDQHSRVYLTKRPSTMKFLGGYYVFPGGAVEQGDMDIDTEHIRNCVSDEAFGSSHYVAAARELFEEVGVLLANNHDGSMANLNLGTEREYRRQLLAGNISFTEILRHENLFFDFNFLNYFGHRITPKESPIRFDTRFFLAKLPSNQIPKPDETEVEEACWMFPEDALIAYKDGQMPLVPPTIDSLETILNHKEGGELMLPKQKNHPFPFKS